MAVGNHFVIVKKHDKITCEGCGRERANKNCSPVQMLCYALFVVGGWMQIVMAQEINRRAWERVAVHPSPILPMAFLGCA